MRWPWRKRIETRASWSDAVAQLEHVLAGNDYADSVRTGGAEIAAGIVERAFASATVEGASELIMQPLTPSMLGYVGRQLILHGESCHLLRTSSGALELLPCQNWEIYGSDPAPSSWTYDCYCSTPSGQFSRRVSSLDVLHVKSGSSRDRPFDGTSAIRNAGELGGAHAKIEQSLRKELKGAAGRVVPAPMDPADKVGGAALQAGINKLEGGPMLVESMASGHGNNLRSESRQSSDWVQKRIGPAPPDALIALRNDLQISCAMLLGIPAELTRSDASSSARREAFRQLFHGTLQPLTKLVQSELQSKLDSPGLMIRMNTLGAADLQGRARALSSMVKAQVKLDDALRLCGLD